MSDSDWHTASRRTLGMLLDGDHIRERNAHGEPVSGDTLAILFNASSEAIDFVLPTRVGGAWECVVDSATDTPASGAAGALAAAQPFSGRLSPPRTRCVTRA